MPQSLSALYIHLIFSTKDRLPLIGDDIAAELHPYLGGIINKHQCVPLGIGGMPDHVHLLISLSRQITVADLVRAVKANSSKWLHDQGHPEVQWQSGYAVFSVSQSNLDTVREYIAHQADHHERVTFKEELCRFLERHGLEYDERYLWD